MTGEKKFLIAVGIFTTILVIAGAFFFGRSPSTEETQQIFTKEELTANSRNTKGNSQSENLIVEFGDFQCPACGSAYPIISKFMEENGENVQLVFRNYPLSIHNNAKIASQAAEAAAEQGKFWEMHDKLFETQKNWSDSDNANEIFEGYAADLSLDVEKYKDDIGKVKSIVEQDFADGNKFNVESTPTFFINGKKYPGVVTEEQLKAALAL